MEENLFLLSENPKIILKKPYWAFFTTIFHVHVTFACIGPYI